MEDAMENRTMPSPSPRPLPRGEGEPANASSRFGECRLRSHAPKLGTTAARPSPTRPSALAHSALPDEPSGSPSPVGRGRGEGVGISLSFTAFFSAFGSGLNSTENGEEPIKAHRALAWLQLPILLQNLFVTGLVESVCAKS